MSDGAGRTQYFLAALNRTSEAIRKGRKLTRLLRVPAYRRSLRLGVAATVEHEDVPFADTYRTVIDVGVGRGQFSVFALHRFPAARIQGFEPLPESFRTATRAAASPRVSISGQAVGATPGRAAIHVTADADSSSLRSPTAEQTRHFPGTDSVETIEVEVVTLDDAVATVERPALLKLDLQGGELDALRGAERLLGSIDTVFAECSFVELYAGQAFADEVIGHLRERGFALRGIFSPTYGEDGTCIQADLLFDRAH
jgi:FkbM family methyltransferase